MFVYFRNESKEPSLSKEEVDIDTVLREFFQDEGVGGGPCFSLLTQVSMYFRHETEEPSLSKEEVDIDTVLREFSQDEGGGACFFSTDPKCLCILDMKQKSQVYLRKKKILTQCSENSSRMKVGGACFSLLTPSVCVF